MPNNIDLEERVNHCVCRIAFMQDVFCHLDTSEPAFTEDGLSGLYLFFDDILEDLKHIQDQLAVKGAADVQAKPNQESPL